MLYKRLTEAGSICVLAVSHGVLAIPGVVITDCNAASDYARFLHPDHWRAIDFDDVFAADWRHANNPARYYQHRSRKCAEVLVPRRVAPELLLGAYVISAAAQEAVRAQAPALQIEIVPDMFFQ